MDTADFHYFSAVVYHFAGMPALATQECYQALECNSGHQPARRLLKKNLFSVQFPFGSITEKVCLLLDLLEQRHLDYFQMLFVSEYGPESSQVAWHHLQPSQQQGTLQARIWKAVVQQQWSKVYEYYRAFSLEKEVGAQLECFLLAYTLLQVEEFQAAQHYISRLVGLGSIAYLCASNLLLQCPQANLKQLIRKRFIQDLNDRQRVYLACRFHETDHSRLLATLLRRSQALSQPESYLSFGKLYWLENQQRKACVYFKKYLQLAPKEVESAQKKLVSFFATTSKCKPNWTTRRFLTQLLAEHSPHHSLVLVQQLVSPFPRFSEKVLAKWQRRFPSEKRFLLAYASCLYHNGRYKQLLQFIRSQDSSPAVSRALFFPWYAQMLAQQHQQFSDACHKLQQYAGSVQASEALFLLFSHYCPCCQQRTNYRPCANCFPDKKNKFAIQENRLTWDHRNQTPFTLTNILWLTSDSCSYQHNDCGKLFIRLLIASSWSLQCYHNQALCWEKQGSGLSEEISLENLQTGEYCFVLATAQGESKEYQIQVYRHLPSLKLEIVSSTHQHPHKTQVRLRVWGKLGPLTDQLQWQISNSQGTRVALEVTSHHHDFELAWKSKGVIGPYLISAKHPQGQGQTLWQPDNKSSLPALSFFPRLQTKIPLQLAKKEQQIHWQFSQSQEQIALWQHDLLKQNVACYRTEQQSALATPETFVACCYLASAGKIFGQPYLQGQWAGVLYSQAHLFEWQVPPTCKRGESLHLTITPQVKGSLQGYLFIQEPNRSYFSLQEQLFAQFACKSFSALAKLKASLIPAKARQSLVFIPLTVSEKFSYCFSSGQLACLPEKFSIVCCLSQGGLWQEQMVQVSQSPKPQVSFLCPQKISSPGWSPATIHYKGFAREPLQLSSNNEQLAWETDKATEGFHQFVISQPQQMSVSSQSQTWSEQVQALEDYEYLQQKWLPVFEPGQGQPLQSLVTSLLDNLMALPLCKTDIITSQLYAWAKVASSPALDFLACKRNWYQQIERLKALLFSHPEFVNAKVWIARQQGKKSWALTAEILYHLAPFLEIPRFPQLQQLAKNQRDFLLNKKIRYNQLLFLHPHFQEKKLSSCRAAASLFLAGLESKASWNYLKKHVHHKDSNQVMWQDHAPGGSTHTTTVVAQVLWREQDPLLPAALTFVGQNMARGVPGNHLTAVALLDLFSEMLTSEQAKPNWQHHSHESLISLHQAGSQSKLFASRNLKMTGKTSHCLRFHLAPAHQDYFVKLLIPPHLQVRFGNQNHWHQGQTPLLAVDSQQLQIRTIAPGGGNLYLVLENCYHGPKILWDSCYCETEKFKSC